MPSILRRARHAASWRPWRTHCRSLIVEVTQRCNLDCKFCYNVWKGDPNYPRGELSTHDLQALLEGVLLETRCRNVTLTGGEPFLRDDIPELAAGLRSHGAELTVVTNATLADEDLARRCVEAGVRTFEVTLLAAKREVHDALARRRAFDAAIDGASSILAAGGSLAVSFVATKANLGELEETIELAVALRARGLALNRFNPGGEGRRWVEELLPTREQVSRALEVADEASGRYGIPIACAVPLPSCMVDGTKYPRVGFGACPLGSRDAYFTIDPLGNLRPCNHSPLRLGSLLEESFARLSRGTTARAYARSAAPRCLACADFGACRGGCRAAAEACSGSPTSEDPWLAACGPCSTASGGTPSC